MKYSCQSYSFDILACYFIYKYFNCTEKLD